VVERLPAFAHCGIGLLTATTPAVDNDVRHPEVADAIDQAVVSTAGEGPVRYGAAPKRLRLYRTEQPFTKLTTAGYRLPGDQPGAKAHKVEVQATGQQVVAYGVHPETEQPYAWPFEAPLDLERDDLPVLSEQAARQIIDEADRILRCAGGVVAEGASRSRKPLANRLPGPPPRPVRNLQEVREVREALRRINPSTLDRDSWIAVGYALRAALGDHGREVWLEWSRRSLKSGKSGCPNTPELTWNRIKPTRCGWRYILELARETK
jgi:hypothetical protein